MVQIKNCSSRTWLLVGLKRNEKCRRINTLFALELNIKIENERKIETDSFLWKFNWNSLCLLSIVKTNNREVFIIQMLHHKTDYWNVYLYKKWNNILFVMLIHVMWLFNKFVLTSNIQYMVALALINVSCSMSYDGIARFYNDIYCPMLWNATEIHQLLVLCSVTFKERLFFKVSAAHRFDVELFKSTF